MDQLADRSKTLAIVGNSPCEIGKSKGDIIDAHDIVVRFNYFSTAPEHVRDYGTRFTIHVRGSKDDPELDKRSRLAATVVLTQGDVLYLVRGWKHPLRLHKDGVRMACMPAGSNLHLQQELLAEPSRGLAFCAFAKSVRGLLSHESCFGFSFTDQIAPNATKARYFGNEAPALTHRWAQERMIFDRLTS
jgi:hypothetical protein